MVWGKSRIILVIILIAAASSISTAFAVGGTNIIFRTSDGTADHEVMRITSDQKVGIGTVKPQEKLTVVSNTPNLAGFFSTGATDSQVIIGSPGGEQSSIIFDDAGLQKWQIGKQRDNGFFMWDNAFQRDFLRSTGGNLTLQPVGGSVGIGTAPTEKLDVAGNMHLSGDLNCNGCVSNSDLASGNKLYTVSAVAGSPGVTSPTVVSCQPGDLAVSGSSDYLPAVFNYFTSFPGPSTNSWRFEWSFTPSFSGTALLVVNCLDITP